MCNRLLRPACTVAVLLLFPLSLMAAEIHVAPDGNDANPGTRDAPLQSLAAARDAARRFAGKEAVTVHVADGVYYLPETLVFTPADSGTEDHPVTYLAENEGGAVLSGGTKLRAQVGTLSRRDLPSGDTGGTGDRPALCRRHPPAHGPLPEL